MCAVLVRGPEFRPDVPLSAEPAVGVDVKCSGPHSPVSSALEVSSVHYGFSLHMLGFNFVENCSSSANTDAGSQFET